MNAIKHYTSLLIHFVLIAPVVTVSVAFPVIAAILQINPIARLFERIGEKKCFISLVLIIDFALLYLFCGGDFSFLVYEEPPGGATVSSRSNIKTVDPAPLTGDYADLDLSGSSITEEITGELSQIAYWTPNGRSYHFTPNCTSLKRSSAIHEGTLQNAISEGKRDPCNICANWS